MATMDLSDEKIISYYYQFKYYNPKLKHATKAKRIRIIRNLSEQLQKCKVVIETCTIKVCENGKTSIDNNVEEDVKNVQNAQLDETAQSAQILEKEEEEQQQHNNEEEEEQGEQESAAAAAALDEVVEEEGAEQEEGEGEGEGFKVPQLLANSQISVESSGISPRVTSTTQNLHDLGTQVSPPHIEMGTLFNYNNNNINNSNNNNNIINSSEEHLEMENIGNVSLNNSRVTSIVLSVPRVMRTALYTNAVAMDLGSSENLINILTPRIRQLIDTSEQDEVMRATTLLQKLNAAEEEDKDKEKTKKKRVYKKKSANEEPVEKKKRGRKPKIQLQAVESNAPNVQQLQTNDEQQSSLIKFYENARWFWEDAEAVTSTTPNLNLSNQVHMHFLMSF